MADEAAPKDGPAPGGATAPGGAPPAAGAEPRMSIEAQYVKDLSFENPKAPNSLRTSDKRPELKVNVEVRARAMTPPTYEVELGIKAEAVRESEVMFIVDLTYAAVVSLANVDKKSIQPILMIEAPRLIYPFARRVIADATRDGGFAPLNLNPIDFQQLFQENQARAAATSGAPGSTKLA